MPHDHLTMRLHLRPLRTTLLLLGLWLVATTAPAAAHTAPDRVAVPAGRPTVVTLRPTHGCGDAPTTAVSTRVPAAGATAGEVAGWTATAVDDGRGNTVVEWNGGSLPADEVGAFPVSFTVPDRVGELLTFPFVQECANGEELAWISGDPASDFPAPRLLVLPADASPAATLDEVPADAPGRDQLAAVVDVDNPGGSTTTTGAASTTATGPAPADRDVQGDDGLPPWIPTAVAVAVIGVTVGLVAAKRRD